jgi:aminopeptidase N
VAWRSYRDQWLSEGFAEYSGLLYMRQRTKSPGDLRTMLEVKRDTLKSPPRTDMGIGRGRVTDIGPIILGHRLSTTRSTNAYTILTYNKGALVLRMLHFLFTDPVSGNGEPFFEMMRDFVSRHRNGAATTESFIQVANQHFARTSIAQKYQIKDLNWFFRQWVWQTHLPSYRLEYKVEKTPDGKAVLRGTLFQENAPQDWAMPLPLVFRFEGNQIARGTILALGPQQSVNIPLPAVPQSVELDPELWVLSEKTATKK